MDILKNIYFNQNINSINLNIDIIIISIIIKIFCFFFIKKNNFFFLYINNFIKKTINYNSRVFSFFFIITIFNYILLSNITDLFPNNFFKKFINIDFVPTSNINITNSYSILSFFIITYLSIISIGIKKFFYFFLKKPINNKYMIFFNFIIEFTSFIMKPISLSLRLFGNVFSSEIIFNLIDKLNIFLMCFLNILWCLFHYLILPLQSYIFITLVTIYISQNLKH